MAFKIKDNLDLYGNQLLNFALQSDSGFPQSPQVGHMFNYTGAGVMANHAVMCVDETTKAFKALAFVDEIATNAEFVELKEKVDLLIGDDVDTDTIIDSWKEVQAFLADIEDTKTLQGMLSSYLPKSGGTMTGNIDYRVPLNQYWASGIVYKDSSDSALAQIGAYSNNSSTIDRIYLGFGTGVWNGENALVIERDKMSFNKNTLLHSGNIGSYGVKIDRSKEQSTASANAGNFVGYGNNSFDNWKTVGPILSFGDAGYYAQFQKKYNSEQLYFRSIINSTKSDWKTIAFTDSTVAAAQKLVTSAGADAVTIDSNKNAYFENIIYGNSQPIVFKNGNDNVAYFGAAHSTISSTLDGVGIMARGGRSIYFSTNGSVQAIINSSGNVLIGATEDNGGKLQVEGNIANLITIKRTGIHGAYIDYVAANASSKQWRVGASNDGSFVFENNNTDSIVNALLINSSGNVTIGDDDYAGTNAKLCVDGNVDITDRLFCKNQIYTGVGLANGLYLYGGNTTGIAWHQNTVYKSTVLSFNPSTGKTTIYGDLEVEGNIIGKKEVSAGGAGQEGESGDGGAEVIAQQLAKGQSTYTITNTIKRSDIAVSLYEANVINGQTIWSLCLADIEVTNSTITVTFGSATSVNHKLVAVG